MFEDLQEQVEKMVGKAGQDMKDTKVQGRIDKFGNIHFTLKSQLGSFGKGDNVEIEWNKFMGKEVTPELVKEELEKLKKVFA